MRLLLALLCSSALLLAQPQQSEHFRITKSVLDAGGAQSSSTNFVLLSAFGQPTPIGYANSSNFDLVAGFLSPRLMVSPLSPIQHLVFKESQPDAILYWEPISGASNYSIHRAGDPAFTPDGSTLIGTTSDTTFTDTNVLTGPYESRFYIIIGNGP